MGTESAAMCLLDGFFFPHSFYVISLTQAEELF